MEGLEWEGEVGGGGGSTGSDRYDEAPNVTH